MKPSMIWLSGAGAGAVLMYLSDPRTGRRRRAGLRDQATRASHKVSGAVGVLARDMRNRIQGLTAELDRYAHPQQGPVEDRVLEERVRARLGRFVSHPRSLQVTAENGYVTLRGPILSGEADAVIVALERVEGVRGLRTEFDLRDRSEDFPDFHGSQVGTAGDNASHWSPTARLLATAAGGILLLAGARRGRLSGLALAGAGAALGMRGLGNREITALLGLHDARAAIEFRKTIAIQAPVEDVFALWSDYANFPRFMSHVRDVRQTGPDQSHWVVQGLAGAPVEWDAVLTDLTENALIAWKTLPGSLAQHAGSVQFTSTENDGTRVDIDLCYNPGLGTIGHAVATLFGVDPKRQMDDDLARMKTFVESGHLPRDAAKSIPKASNGS